jgi:O-antigen/teichoic acid export membrane protein
LQVSFARHAQAPDRLELLYRKAERVIALIGFAAAAVLACTADDLVEVLFGAEWRPMGYLLRVLALSIGAQSLIGLGGALLRGIGHTKLLFGLGTVSTILELGSMAVAAFWSVRAVAWAYTGASFVALPLMIAVICDRLGFSLVRTAREVLAALPAPGMLALLLLVPRLAAGSWTAAERLVLQIALISATCPYFVRSIRRLLRSGAQ